MILGQRIRLDPNNVQMTQLERFAGAARFVYNLGLDRWQQVYKAGGKPNWQSINREVNARKRSDLFWLKELPWAVPNSALQDLNNAFQHFFRRVKIGEKPGYPRFKSKKRTKPAFSIEGRAIQFDALRIKVPKIGWIRTRQALRFPGNILSARFSKHAGHWYVSVQVKVDEARWSYPHRCETQAAVGVDLGVVNLAVLSTGERIEAPRALRQIEKRQRMLNKELSRRHKGGKNWQKTRTKLQRLYERSTNVRKNVTHKLTAQLVRRFRWIGIEDLNIRGMVANRRLAKSIMDAAMAEVGRQLNYKAKFAGTTVVRANRWFASSKTCSTCGLVYDALSLSERHWFCECGTKHDRDENAAENLKQLAATYAVTACCPESAGLSIKGKTKLLVEQESSSCVNQF